MREQGYLAHQKTPTPLGPPWDPRHKPTVWSYVEAVSDERGNPVPSVEEEVAAEHFPHQVERRPPLALVVPCLRVQGLQGYLAHKKPPPPRNLP